MSRRLSTLAWLCSSPGSPRQRKRAGNSAQQGGQNGSVRACGQGRAGRSRQMDRCARVVAAPSLLLAKQSLSLLG